MAIETIRISVQGREQLSRLKRYTGIEHWNVLCRWAFCVSLAEPTRPPETKQKSDSAVEMTWKTFGGPYAEIYWALLEERCYREGISLEQERLAEQFRLHLHRGAELLGGKS
jgi:DNA sulfur modification protein DndE